MKSSKLSIKTRSTPASLSFKGQVTKHTTVKWSILEYQQPKELSSFSFIYNNLRIAKVKNIEFYGNYLRFKFSS